MISISLLNIKDNNDILKINETNIENVHLDVMDGIFVNNKTFTIQEDVIRLKGLNKKIDIHLMVKDVKKYIDDYKIFKPDYITFHVEALKDIENIIKYIKSLNIKVGIAVSPNTSIDVILPYLKDIDLVLAMSVEPGLGGQKFMIETIDKVNKLKDIRNKNNLNYLIQVDGGINNETIKQVDADIYVVGSYITNSDNYQEKINELLV